MTDHFDRAMKLLMSVEYVMPRDNTQRVEITDAADLRNVLSGQRGDFRVFTQDKQHARAYAAVVRNMGGRADRTDYGLFVVLP